MLTLQERHRHLLLFFFGAGADPVEQCVYRAYRDFSRTMHGLGSLPKPSEAGHHYLYASLQELKFSQEVRDQKSFDAWHEQVCTKLIDVVRNAGYENMRVGQAQKWINMALKYSFIFPPEDIPEFSKLFEWCHIPIDNIILGSEAFKGAPKLKVAWSRIVEYRTYMSLQLWARQAFPGQFPLAVEFKAWAGSRVAA